MPIGAALDQRYTMYAQGVIHFPIYDAEYLENGFTITQIRPLPPGGSFQPALFWDDTEIGTQPFAGATAEDMQEFNGCTSPPCHTWNYLGDPSVPGYGNMNTLNTWWFANREISAPGGSAAMPDYLDVRIGNNEPSQLACPEQSIVLDAQVRYALGGAYTSVEWIGGNGSFAPDRATAAAVYMPTPEEHAAGGVTLTLRPAGTCSTPERTVNFVFDIQATACANFPVEWLGFEGRLQNGTPVLQWETARETNSDYFAVERQVAGQPFEVVGRVAAAGNSTQVRRYTYPDEAKAGLAGQPVARYRLRQVDIDGATDYSRTIEVALEAGYRPILLHVFPNPADEVANLRLDPGHMATATLRVVNLAGQEVWSQTIEGSSEVQLPVADWAPGTYVLSLGNGVQTAQQKLIVR
ncbi:MAG: hypothetical protein OHK0039_09210 [Bacteroidia bacterium]